MKNSDIQELLDHTKNHIDEVLVETSKGNVSKVKIKNVLENLRSILDYSAKLILPLYNEKSGRTKKKVYFPYGLNEESFKFSINKNFPKIDEHLPEFYNLISSLQPHISSTDWLIKLCNLTNEAKHNNLNKTEKIKHLSVKQGNFIKVENFTNVVMKNNYANGVRLDDVYIDSNRNVKVVPHSKTTEITEKNSFIFHGQEEEISPFLKLCYQKIEKFSQEFDDLLS